MKKVLYSLLVVGILTTIVVGSGTMTYFNDVEKSNGNTFTAGTLDCEYRLLHATDPSEGDSTAKYDGDGTAGSAWVGDGGGYTDAYFRVWNIKPGDSGNMIWTVKNNGTITGYLDLQNLDVTNSPGDTPEAEAALQTPDTGELGAKMNVTIWKDDGDGSIESGESIIYSDTTPSGAKGTMDDLDGRNFDDTNIQLSRGSSTNIALLWTVGTDVGNSIMDDSVELNMTFELAQTRGQ